MSETSEAVVLSYLNLSWNTGKFHLVKNFLSPDFHYKTTFSDEIMSKEDRVMTSISFSGTVEESIFGIPVSENIITFPAVSLWSVTKGKITRLDTLIDILGIERQLKTGLHPDKPLKERLS